MSHGSIRSYIIGFAWSLSLTIGAYIAAVNHMLEGFGLLIALLLIAIAQLFVQLVYFLHLGKEKDPKWNQMMFGLMAIMVTILVAGTIWIMYNLDRTHSTRTTGQELDNFIIEDEGILR